MSDFRLPEPGNPIVPLSRAAIIRHAEQHPCPDTDDGAVMRVCPCDRTLIICCAVCNEAVFAIPMTPHDYCEHLAELVPTAGGGEFRLPSPAKAQARERLLRDAEIVRSAGKAWIADAMVIGATDALPEDAAVDIVAATALAVSEIERPPGWVVALFDETAQPFAYWNHMPSRSETN